MPMRAAAALAAAALLAGSARPEEPPVLRVPAGFVVERVTPPGLVRHPVMAGFDDQGRLYVAESAGLNLKADELLKRLPDRILRLEDTTGDGRFDRSVVFADRLSFPQGVLWHEGAVYVCSPPSLWKLEDTTGDGVCDRRTELVTKFGFIGNAADIHGPFLSPAGWLYWNDGRHGHRIEREDGSVLEGKAARIFRCRPDGTGVEVVCGGGMDNPVETAFTAEGEALATVALLHAAPRRVDGIIHAVEGGVFPYHEVLREFKRTGELLGPVTDLGWVAPSGLMRYRSGAFGEEYRNNLFSALFNTHKVLRHVLVRDGATFRTRDEEFLVSTSTDFHPTDVLEDADGSLLVVDTGGWFRIGCPTSRVAKPEVLGAIYRIRRTDAPRIEDPWGRSIRWDALSVSDLLGLLEDPRFGVRDRAVARLARTASEEAIEEAVRTGPSERARRNAVWAAARAGRAGPLRAGLEDPDAGVRLAATYAVGLLRVGGAEARLARMAVEDTPPVRREAATALGRLGRPEAVPALLASLRAGGDRILEHAVVYALLRIGASEPLREALEDPHPRVRRGALVALDQMEDGGLTREEVTRLLDGSDATLRKAAIEVILSRQGWAGEVKGLAAQWLAAERLDGATETHLRGILAAFAADPSIQDLVAGALRSRRTAAPVRTLLLEAMAQAPLDRLPATWRAEARWALEDPDERVVRQAVAVLRAFGEGEFDAALRELARDETRSRELRVAALAATAARAPRLEPDLFGLLVETLGSDAPALVRLAAADALGQAALDDRQLERLTERAAGAGGLELPRLLAAFGRSRHAPVGRRLVAALEQAPGLPGLSAEALRAALAGFPDEVRRLAEPLYGRLETDLAAQKARLEELRPVLGGGDPGRGRELFFGARAGCGGCHAVGGQGGRLGPDLSRIGAIRTPEDLLEAIVFPSASFVRGYEPYVVRTRDGEVLGGILARETADAIYLAGADGTERRVRRASIEVFQPGRLSVMPEGLDRQLSRDELADLVAFLAALK